MKQVIALSIALTAALVGSYLVWTDDAETFSAEEVPLYTAAEADLETIHWSTKTKDITVSRRSDERGPYFWIESVERIVPVENPHEEEEEPADGEADPAGETDGEEPVLDEPVDSDPDRGTEEEPVEEAPAEPVEKRVAFLGNEEAEKLWTNYAPLRALRELPSDGSITDDAFGLEDPEGSLEVVRRGQTVTLQVGGEAYGSKDRYVRQDGRTYLVDDGDLRPLQFATTRLVERGLYPFNEADIARIEVAFDGRSDAFVQQNADDRTKAFWARADTPSDEDDVVDTWVGKLLKLRLRAYVDETELGPIEPRFRFVVSDGTDSWPVEVLRSEGPQGKWYARSAFNRSMVELTGSIAENIVDDLPEVLPE